jgi:hypothetical protein
LFQLCRMFFLAMLLFFPCVSLTQNNPTKLTTTPPLPTDPAKFLAIAAKVNGLAAESVGPWHAKASFQLIDKRGNVSETGTYEAFWKSPSKYKLSYTSPSYTRTIWANESGNFATTNPKWPGDLEWMIRRSLFDLVPEPRELSYSDTNWKKNSNGGHLNCLTIAPLNAVSPQAIPTYCFESGTPIVRYGSEIFQTYQASFNSIILFDGSYVAKDVELLRAGKPYFRLYVDTLEPLVTAEDALFRPDSNAIPIPRRGLLDTDLRYVDAKSAGMSRSRSGTWGGPSMFNPEVIVQVLVNEKGAVVDARAVKGETSGVFSAVTAARQWWFKPYLVDGQPTAFYTELEFW